MKVIQVNSACGAGSTGKIVVAISQLMSQNGIENYIFYSGNKKSKYLLGRMVNSKIDIRIHQILSRLFGDQGWHSCFYTKKMIRELEAICPDIIHIHNLHGYYININILFNYFKRKGIPVIWTLHDCWPLTGHCTHFTRAKCEKWKTECYSCPQKSSYPYSLLFDRSSELFRRKKALYAGIQRLYVTTVSEWLKGIVQQSSLLKDRSIFVIPNGINLSIFREMEPVRQIKGFDLTNKEVVLGVANSWGQGKGLEDFIKLSSILNDNYKIILVGLSEKQLQKLPNNIIGMSRTNSQEELVRLYSTATVYFSPSREETFGLTIVEALACGTPVVVYNSTACPELVEKDCGFVVEAGSIDSVKNCIEIISDLGKQHFSHSCRIHAEKFNQEIIYKSYLELYQKVLTENE